VVLFEIISNFLIISLLIKPLKIKKIKKVEKPKNVPENKNDKNLEKEKKFDDKKNKKIKKIIYEDLFERISTVDLFKYEQLDKKVSFEPKVSDETEKIFLN